MRSEYAKSVDRSIHKSEASSQEDIEKLNFEEMCQFAHKVLNCDHLGASAYYWADVCGVSVRWVWAWKNSGKAIHPDHVRKIVEELPELIEKANSRVDYLRIWGARMSLMFLSKEMEGK